MKVVINRSYGGFDLPQYGHELYFAKTGREFNEWLCRNERRCDPALVEVVEDLGEYAGSLEVVEVEDGRPFMIHEYDGMEGIWYQDQMDWIMPSPELPEKVRATIQSHRDEEADFD